MTNLKTEQSASFTITGGSTMLTSLGLGNSGVRMAVLRARRQGATQLRRRPDWLPHPYVMSLRFLGHLGLPISDDHALREKALRTIASL